MQKKCLACGKMYEQKRRWQRVCSTACRMRAYRKENATLFVKRCIICGKEFKTIYDRQSVCSFTCKEKRARLFNKQRSRKEKYHFTDDGGLNARERSYKKIAEDAGWKVYHRGFPDFLMFDPLAKKIKFVEIKGIRRSADGCTSEQRELIDILKLVGLDVEVVYVD